MKKQRAEEKREEVEEEVEEEEEEWRTVPQPRTAPELPHPFNEFDMVGSRSLSTAEQRQLENAINTLQDRQNDILQYITFLDEERRQLYQIIRTHEHRRQRRNLPPPPPPRPDPSSPPPDRIIPVSTASKCK